MRTGDDVHHAEEGAISVASAGVLLMLMVLSTLIVDLGSHVLAERDLQGAVDLAALDAANALTYDSDPTLADEYARAAIAADEGWGSQDGRTVDVVLGRFDEATRTFTPGGGEPDAVMVEAATQLSRLTGAVSGTDTVRRRAVARLTELSAISIGTHVAAVDSGRAELLSRVLSALLGGPVTIDAIGYEGLGSANLPLGVLAAELGLGSVDELLDTRVTVPGLLAATASGLSASGDPLLVQAATALGGSSVGAIDGQTDLSLRDLVHVQQGVPGSVATVEVNALDLLVGSAMLVNRDNVVGLDLGLDQLPGVTTGDVNLHVIEPPQPAVGRPGVDGNGVARTVAQSAQLRLGVDLVLDPLGDVNGVSVGSTSLPVVVDAARGTATLTGLGCISDVSVGHSRTFVETATSGVTFAPASATALTTSPVSGSAGLTASAPGVFTELALDVGLLGLEVPIASVEASGQVEVPGDSGEVVLDGPFRSTQRFAGATPFADAAPGAPSIAGLLDDLELATTLEALPSDVGLGLSFQVGASASDGDTSAGTGGETDLDLTLDVLGPAVTRLQSVVGRVDSTVGGVLDVLGVASLGDADIAANSVSCSGRELVR